MYTRILAILLDIGIIFAAGLWLCWIGIMPVKLGPQKIDLPPDSDLNWFRIFARIMGPVIIVFTSWQMVHDVRRFAQPAVITWQDFHSTEGRFQVDLPSQPDISNRDIGMFDRSVTEYKFKAETSERDMTFLVSYVDCPEALGNLKAIDFLDSELESRVQSSDVRLLKKRSATVGDCPAIYFSMDATQQGFHVDGYLILDHFRLYQLGAQYIDERTEASRQRFLDSFRIVRKAN